MSTIPNLVRGALGSWRGGHRLGERNPFGRGNCPISGQPCYSTAWFKSAALRQYTLDRVRPKAAIDPRDNEKQCKVRKQWRRDSNGKRPTEPLTHHQLACCGLVDILKPRRFLFQKLLRRNDRRWPLPRVRRWWSEIGCCFPPRFPAPS